ncbi:LysE/ArgO family amino acid transporter [Orbaceae bacterium ESL0721]|nr:LysE/ArgO family amino acid transporter [Orbaceae bacterium ESL0721]
MIAEILNGAMISASLIIAIGAQNLFVLKQGLLKEHIFWVCLICFICDFLLLSIGVLGVGAFINQYPLLTQLVALAGVLFLIWYGILSFKSAWQGTSSLQVSSSNNQKKPLLAVVLSTLAVTLLNPHVYLDTVVIVGGIAGTLNGEQKVAFLIGAVIVSCIWFFGIGYGARLLAPLFKQKRVWTVLDCLIGIIMFYIAALLIKYLLISS